MFQYLKSIIAGMKGGAAQGHLMRGNYQKALSLVDKAIQLDPDGVTNPVYLSIKGKCHFHLNEKDRAKECLVKAEEHLIPLLKDDDKGYMLGEISTVKSYIEKCG